MIGAFSYWLESQPCTKMPFSHNFNVPCLKYGLNEQVKVTVLMVLLYVLTKLRTGDCKTAGVYWVYVLKPYVLLIVYVVFLCEREALY